MRSQHFPIPFEEFELLPRRLGWKYEYWDGQAHLSPRDQSVSVVLPVRPATATGRRSVQSGGRTLLTTGEPIRLGPAMPDGQRELVSAYIRAFRDSIEFCDWPEERIEEQARQDLEGFFAGRRGKPLDASRVALDVAAGSGEPRALGAALLLEVAPQTALLDLLFVVPGRQRRGLATALVSDAAEGLFRHGFRRFESRYHLGNEASRAWHLRFGFVDEPDLFLAESMLHHVRHEIWRREKLGAFVPDERASLEAELERWRAQVGTLESRARREGMEAVVPLLRRHRR